ncbi:MAG TPA: hypothetical protein VMW41_02610 [Candidatus Bathyarchaeia archaeon]|nr:hypothetical protein [Candidatus Bathyarchaeia archaeon]
MAKKVNIFRKTPLFTFILAVFLFFINVLLISKQRTGPTENQPAEARFDFFCGCSDEDTPVCGSNYFTYPNTCEAECDQAQILYPGRCRLYDPKKPLPDQCSTCDLNCLEQGQIYLDTNGCPVCQCILND